MTLVNRYLEVHVLLKTLHSVSTFRFKFSRANQQLTPLSVAKAHICKSPDYCSLSGLHKSFRTTYLLPLFIFYLPHEGQIGSARGPVVSVNSAKGEQTLCSWRGSGCEEVRFSHPTNFGRTLEPCFNIHLSAIINADTDA